MSVGDISFFLVLPTPSSPLLHQNNPNPRLRYTHQSLPTPTNLPSSIYPIPTYNCTSTPPLPPYQQRYYLRPTT
ncbi:hypothetical protein P280DRAFT_472835 [Massarina eburnea CBS 473.64]|uniref:Uncharacterized protein n=1 Tax=Massarina eburnea CBS 473.64 TaxID=1395130 RepID=A0A6A6RMM3_9PLEO|nr:hypothetical protein P280DRAFT_472835 [Massarina eburnea CBS 473.64]